MALPPIRPRFALDLRCTAAEAVARLERSLEATGSPCVGRVVGEHVDLAAPKTERHLWSPCLHVEFNDRDDGAVAHVLIGPRPNLWTMFAFSYGTIGSGLFFALLLGLVQVALGESPWGLWLVPFALVAVAALYWVSQVGQRLAADEMRALRTFLEHALDGVVASASADALRTVDQNDVLRR